MRVDSALRCRSGARWSARASRALRRAGSSCLASPDWPCRSWCFTGPRCRYADAVFSSRRLRRPAAVRAPVRSVRLRPESVLSQLPPRRDCHSRDVAERLGRRRSWCSPPRTSEWLVRFEEGKFARARSPSNTRRYKPRPDASCRGFPSGPARTPHRLLQLGAGRMWQGWLGMWAGSFAPALCISDRRLRPRSPEPHLREPEPRPRLRVLELRRHAPEGSYRSMPRAV